MASDISHQIKELPAFSRAKLVNLWKELYGREVPTGIKRSFLVPFLAYRIQERAYGGLSTATRAELRRIASACESRIQGADRPSPTRIKSGSRLVRHWRGQAYEVFVTDAGYEYRGISYLSLSQIAREITGTRWSGPLFFGLKARPKAAK